MTDLISALAIASLIILPALGVGLGQGAIDRALIETTNQQPAAHEALRRLTIISLTLSETAVLLNVIMALLLITQRITTPFNYLAYLGITCAVAIPGFLVGIITPRPATHALYATARQPFFAGRILQLLLLTQTIIQTPVIFGFIIAFLIYNQAPITNHVSEGIRLFMSGFTFALGSWGSLMGLGAFSRTVLRAVGTNRALYDSLRTFTFIAQALIEAPVVFTLIISLVLATITPSYNSLLDMSVFLGMAISMGSTASIAGFNSGRTAQSAAYQISRKPELYPLLSRVSILAQTLIDTSPIYGLITSFILFLTGFTR